MTGQQGDFYQYMWPHDNDIKEADKKKKFRIPRGQSEAEGMPTLSGKAHVVTVKRSFNPNVPLPRSSKLDGVIDLSEMVDQLRENTFVEPKNSTADEDAFNDYSDDEYPDLPNIHGESAPFKQVRDAMPLGEEGGIFDLKNLPNEIVHNTYMQRMDEFQDLQALTRALDVEALCPVFGGHHFYGRSKEHPEGDLVLERRESALGMIRALLGSEIAFWNGHDLPTPAEYNTKANLLLEIDSLAEVTWEKISQHFPAATVKQERMEVFKPVTALSHIWWTTERVLDIKSRVEELAEKVWQSGQELFLEATGRQQQAVKVGKPAETVTGSHKFSLKGWERTSAFSHYVMAPKAHEESFKSMLIHNGQFAVDRKKQATGVAKAKAKEIAVAKKAAALVKGAVRKPPPPVGKSVAKKAAAAKPKGRPKKKTMGYEFLIPFGYKGYGPPSKNVYEAAGWTKDESGTLQPPNAQRTPLNPPVRISLREMALAALNDEQFDITKLAIPPDVAQSNPTFAEQVEIMRDYFQYVTDPWQTAVSYQFTWYEELGELFKPARGKDVTLIFGWQGQKYARANFLNHVGFQGDFKEKVMEDHKHGEGDGESPHTMLMKFLPGCPSCAMEVFRWMIHMVIDEASWIDHNAPHLLPNATKEMREWGERRERELLMKHQRDMEDEGTKSASLVVTPLSSQTPLVDLTAQQDVDEDSAGPMTPLASVVGEKPEVLDTPVFGNGLNASSLLSGDEGKLADGPVFVEDYVPSPTGRISQFIQEGGRLSSVRLNEDSDELNFAEVSTPQDVVLRMEELSVLQDRQEALEDLFHTSSEDADPLGETVELEQGGQDEDMI